MAPDSERGDGSISSYLKSFFTPSGESSPDHPATPMVSEVPDAIPPRLKVKAAHGDVMPGALRA